MNAFYFMIQVRIYNNYLLIITTDIHYLNTIFNQTNQQTV